MVFRIKKIAFTETTIKIEFGRNSENRQHQKKKGGKQEHTCIAPSTKDFRKKRENLKYSTSLSTSTYFRCYILYLSSIEIKIKEDLRISLVSMSFTKFYYTQNQISKY